jgi:hypothetical protein
MEMLDQPSWRWGLSLIALTLAFHATAVVMLGIVAVKIRVRPETHGLDMSKLVPIMICMVVQMPLKACWLSQKIVKKPSPSSSRA